MKNINLHNLTITTAHQAMLAGEFTPSDLLENYLAVIAEVNPNLNAVLEVFDSSREQAKIADEQFKNGTVTILTGIPYIVKDNILVRGHIASAGSQILRNYVASYDATVIEKLTEAGAIVVGRANMDEFAMGSSTENSSYGRVKHPTDPDRVPGGSSGGSAAILATDGALFTLGTDTGGSIRQPAAFCGLVGLYPTYGTVSRYGAIAMGSSLDQIGPFTKNVEDAEIIYNIITGYDARDGQSVGVTPSPLQERVGVRSEIIEYKKVIGVPWKILEMPGIDASIIENFKNSVEQLRSVGHEIREIDLPHAHLGLAVYYIIMPAELSTNLSRMDGIRFGMRSQAENLLDTYMDSRADGFGPETRRRVMLGTHVLSAGYYDAYYNKAQLVRGLIRRDYDHVFESGVDIILTPTTPTTAFKAGEKSDPLAMYMADMFTAGTNLAHVPAISLPSGTDESGLPIGIQAIARPSHESHLFQFGKDFESL
jgi:aspartyl-tRNA(Asn)/glutamyl-tRNA(Gln) amidotransferase subunit A